jgi:sec-independent protein translocase protein TatA
MPNLGAPEIVVIAIVVLILFGSKKMPDAARSLGRSLRIFKAETRGLRADEQAGGVPPRSPAARAEDVLIDGRPLETRPSERDPREPR